MSIYAPGFKSTPENKSSTGIPDKILLSPKALTWFYESTQEFFSCIANDQAEQHLDPKSKNTIA